jgi:4-hydroxythreonine-4-phosphate dehydrogenase
VKPILAVTTGDPFGIGPEVCLKAAFSPAVREACRPLLIGDRAHLIEVARRLPGGVGGDPETWPEVSRVDSGWGSRQGDDFGLAAWPEGAAFHDLGDRPARPDRPGPSAAGGRSAVMYIKQAVALVRTGAAAAVVTGPISKTALRLAGHDYPGQTELLADLCGLDRDAVAMLFVTDEIKVALVSVHQPLREAIAGLSRAAVEARLRLLQAEHRRWFGSDPRLALCALNPHAGEAGLFGREEEEILMPAAQAARAAGVNVAGPFPADTLFARAARGEFDAVLALYHDQATIAVKTRSFGGAVNMTVGLPFLRTSVDHGTAYEIAGEGRADASSMVQAMTLAARLAGRAG